MNDELLLSSVRSVLIKSVMESIPKCQIHSLAFALRICDGKLALETGLITVLDKLTGDAAYGGFPEVASLGFKLGLIAENSTSLEKCFLDGIKRQKNRSKKALEGLAVDDVALLGFADGLFALKKNISAPEIEENCAWLINLINQEPKREIWTTRLRDLAGDLLDNRGRLKSLPTWNEFNSASLELVLRDTWSKQFTEIESPTYDTYQFVISNLVKYAKPNIEQIEKSTIWLKVLDLLVEQKSESLFPRGETEKLALSLLRRMKERLDIIARRSAVIQFVLSILMIVPIWVAYYLIKEKLSQSIQNTAEFAIVIIPLISGYLYYAITQREINPKEIFSQIWDKQKKALYKKVGFDIEIYESIR